MKSVTTVSTDRSATAATTDKPQDANITQPSTSSNITTQPTITRLFKSTTAKPVTRKPNITLKLELDKLFIMIVSTLFILQTLLFVNGQHGRSEEVNSRGLIFNKDLQSKIYETTFKKPSELVVKNGFDYEEHKVVTKDGYILAVHRILHKTKKSEKPPVLFVNGFAVASDNWLIRRRDEALPYILVDEGYDVWLGDHRGTYESQEHISLPVNSLSFWNGSVEEHGTYDLPAFIDYILERTNYEQLFYVGQSMGATVFLIMGSELPEYNNKVRHAALFSPAGVGPIQPSPMSRALFRISPFLFAIARGRVRNLVPKDLTRPLTYLCYKRGFQEVCLYLLTTLFGTSRENIDLERLGHYTNTWGAGASLKSAEHYIQMFKAGRLQKYDYGRGGNIEAYGTPTPPAYNLGKVTAPITLYYGRSDYFMSDKAVDNARTQIPNIQIFEVPDPTFSHIDPIFGDNNNLINDDIVNVFNKESPTVAKKTIK